MGPFIQHTPITLHAKPRCANTGGRLQPIASDRSISPIPQYVSSISHNTPFRTEMYTFLFWIVEYGTGALRGLGDWSNSLIREITTGRRCRFIADHDRSACCCLAYHYSDVIMSAMASQITGVTIVYLTVCLGVDQRKHHSSASLAFVRGINGEFPTQRTSDAENVSTWWRHHAQTVAYDSNC